jgi:hypothetical protein
MNQHTQERDQLREVLIEALKPFANYTTGNPDWVEKARKLLEVIKEQFVDAQEMAKNHPDTFEAPTREELDSISVGDYVKICAEPERFWVIVEQIDGDKITGTVNNDLVCTGKHGLENEDKIMFEKRHVYTTMKS